MDVSLKPLDQQVMVITGASSGIGLATALAAAKQGVKLVLGARSKQTLDEVVRHIDEQGGEAIAVQVDVGIDDEVRQLAAAALERFGRIDTWVNDAGLSIYGRIDEVGHKDSERMFQTNFWGVVYGSVAALPHLKSSGGTLINVGSEVSEATIPLQGMYSASKHAVKAFTDALRMELEADKAPVSVTLIQPTAVDTPYPEHAGNYMSLEPKLPTPMIEPEKVASAILDAATDPTDSTKVGAMSVLNTTMAKSCRRSARRWPRCRSAVSNATSRRIRATGRCIAAASQGGCVGEATRTRRRPAKPGAPTFDPRDDSAVEGSNPCSNCCKVESALKTRVGASASTRRSCIGAPALTNGRGAARPSCEGSRARSAMRGCALMVSGPIHKSPSRRAGWMPIRFQVRRSRLRRHPGRRLGRHLPGASSTSRGTN